MTFGERMRKARMKKGITQEDLAKALCISRPSLTGYETSFCHPSFANAVKISRYLKFSLNKLCIEETRRSQL